MASRNRSGYSPIVLTAANATASAPPYSTFSYTFPSNVNLTDKQLSLAALSLYYSWANVYAAPPYGPNNTFSFQWVDSSVNVVTLPSPGGYAVTDINAYYDFVCETLGFFLVDNNGNNVYYGQFLTNVTAYAVQWLSQTIPLTLPAGWSVPAAAAAWYAAYQGGATPLGPQLRITNAAFGSLIGFNVGSYPSSGLPAANYTVLSQFTPELSPVSSVLVGCSATVNYLSPQTSVIYSFAPTGTSFGGTISVQPPVLLWCKCIPGQQQTIQVTFLDQNYNPLAIMDSQVTTLLCIRDAPG